ncbi:hypothetical protein ONZ51_g2590 [Trametes cubensis]|uniref:Uncharacterized protein n=1 Tax=Trametes cubensis TaxID=1111947 RepID=A0AAD7TZG0_9APHY|nr:hypothetical protein ONZ51_g2590 [Trametes cubensis]
MPHLNIPVYKINQANLRIKHKPRVMVGRVSFEIAPGTGLSLNDWYTRPTGQMKARVPGFADQSILATGLPEIQLKFCWPGYEHLDIVEHCPLVGLKCNGQVAQAVAGAFKIFMQKAAQVACKEPRFAIAPGSPYNMQTVVLITLRHVCGDVFIAEVDYQPSIPSSRMMS